MYCPTCGNEITPELKYCNRCGANLTLTAGNLAMYVPAPVKLTAPTVVLGLTIVVGMGIIMGGATELAQMNVHPAFITWIVLFSMLTLFGTSALLLRFWSKMLTLQRQNPVLTQNIKPQVQPFTPQHQLPPRYDSVPSVTEHTTRTFTPIYRGPSEPS